MRIYSIVLACIFSMLAINLSFGQNTVYWNHTTSPGNQNTLFGSQAGAKIAKSSETNGQSNSIFGFQAGFSLINGYNNLFLGYSAGRSNTTGFGNIFIGASAGFNELGSNKLYIHNSSTATPLLYGDFSTLQLGINSLPLTSQTLTIGGNTTIKGSTSEAFTIQNNGETDIRFKDFTNAQDWQVGTNANGFYFFDSEYRMVVKKGGNIGIGTLTPSAKLEVYATSTSASDNTARFLAPNIGPNNSHIHHGLNGDWYIRSAKSIGKIVIQDTGGDVIIPTSGSVAIGTSKVDPNYKLSVDGKIKTREIKVTSATLSWSDYVFEEDYKLRSLEEVESFINENKHLPEVPSAKEVRENGIDLAETDALLLKKIEELTLYMIEQKKEIENLKKENLKMKELIKVKN